MARRFVGTTRRRWVAGVSLAFFVSVTAHAQALRLVTVASGLERPWSLAFLPGSESDARMLVTEKAGRMRLIDAHGEVGPALVGLPSVDARGQGGLLDVVLDPQFAQNRWIYWSYSEPGSAGTNGTAVARGKLQSNGLQGHLDEVKVIFRQAPKFASTGHFGSRLVFARDGRLFVTLGDRFHRRDDAQTLSNHLGKIIRIEPDGRSPADNPFASRAGALPEIWSLGHRNVQGAALHPKTGAVWTHEHGPKGGDEVNVVHAGRNYGWPVVTFGGEYGSGARIGEGTAKAGMQPPLVHWTPSIAPSGMAFLTSDRYPQWKGDLFVGALRGQALVRLRFEGEKLVHQERLLSGSGKRIRDVRQGPDGWLYLLTDDSVGEVLRLER